MKDKESLNIRDLCPRKYHYSCNCVTGGKTSANAGVAGLMVGRSWVVLEGSIRIGFTGYCNI